MVTIVGDVTGLQQLHHPKNIPKKNCWEDRKLSIEGKSFRNNATYQKLWGSFNPHPPPPPYTTVGVLICVYVWGLRVRSFGMIRIRISNPRSFGLWYMFWTDESLSRVDSSVYFMQRYPSDLGSFILIGIIQEDRTLNFWYLVCSCQSFQFRFGNT